MLLRAPLAFSVLLGACSCGAAQTPSRSPTPVELVIDNRRAAPIFVLSQATCSFQAWGVRDADGSAVHLDSGQSISCDTAREGHCPVAGGCAGARVLRIEPGASHRQTWDGVAANETRIDDPAEGCPSHCVEWRAPAAGAYTASVQAFGSCEGDCSCDPGGEVGECARFDGLPAEPDLSAEAGFALPAAGPVVLVFD